MPRGGNRLNAGRPAQPAWVHLRNGTFRADRHGPRPATVAPLPAPEAAAAPEWIPSASQRAELSGLARQWLDAAVLAYSFSPIEGLALHLALKTLTRIEALERNGSSPALSRELRTFGQQWAGLQLEK